MKYYWAIFIAASVAFTNIKPRFVSLDRELKNAKFISEVIIDKYDNKANVYFHVSGFKKKTRKASTELPVNPDNIFSMKDPQDLAQWTGSWPKLNSKVLIVIDSTNKVSLFAEIRHDYYRFWSPFDNWDHSTALFNYTPPAMGLHADSLHGSPLYFDGMDGCLFPITALKKIRR